MSEEDPRQRLIESGLDLFGKYSFDGASTRMLTERAQVNLAAIKYYFGGKEGLYLAVAEHIVEEINDWLAPRLAKVQDALKKETLSKEQSFNLLFELLEFFITGLLGRPRFDRWLSFMLREQLCPTEAFAILFEGFMRPLDRALFGLAARIMDKGPDDQLVRLRVFAIMGEIQVFHMSPGAIKRTMKWDNYGPDNLDAICRVIMENVRRIFSMSPDGSDLGSDKGRVS